MKKSIVLVVFVFLSLMILSAGMARQKTDEKVVCPVSGETMLKSQAKASYEYEGKTYYFCCEGCRTKFVKDPAAYIAKQEASPAVYTCPMHPEVQSDKPGKCPKCGMNLEKKPAAVQPQRGMGMGMAMKEGEACPMMGMMTMEGTMVVSENLKDGIAVKITSQDPETVKKLQDMGAKITAMHERK